MHRQRARPIPRFPYNPYKFPGDDGEENELLLTEKDLAANNVVYCRREIMNQMRCTQWAKEEYLKSNLDPSQSNEWFLYHLKKCLDPFFDARECVAVYEDKQIKARRKKITDEECTDFALPDGALSEAVKKNDNPKKPTDYLEDKPAALRKMRASIKDAYEKVDAQINQRRAEMREQNYRGGDQTTTTTTTAATVQQTPRQKEESEMEATLDELYPGIAKSNAVYKRLHEEKAKKLKEQEKLEEQQSKLQPPKKGENNNSSSWFSWFRSK